MLFLPRMLVNVQIKTVFYRFNFISFTWETEVGNIPSIVRRKEKVFNNIDWLSFVRLNFNKKKSCYREMCYRYSMSEVLQSASIWQHCWPILIIKTIRNKSICIGTSKLVNNSIQNYIGQNSNFSLSSTCNSIEISTSCKGTKTSIPFGILVRVMKFCYENSVIRPSW